MHQITIRELIDMQDHLRLESTNIASFQHYARECVDPQMKNLCQQMAQRRMQAFQMLSQFIGPNMH